jgi:pyrroloquinoline quinone biosynthesis protein D
MTDSPSPPLPRTRAVATPESKPSLPRHIKLRHDAGRGRWLLLAPERVFEPDDTAVDVLKLCDGVRTIRAIADELSRLYQAPAADIEADVVTMVQDLADKGAVRV